LGKINRPGIEFAAWLASQFSNHGGGIAYAACLKGFA
jgi:hypothetical protein